MEDQPLLESIANKIGLGHKEIVSKAAEFKRLLGCKDQLCISPTMQIIACLDIAAEHHGTEFDQANMLQIYNYSKIKYKRALLVLKNVLEVAKPKTIHEISVQLGCEPASQLASQLLLKYKAKDMIDRDFNHPMYAVAAVYTICTLKKIAVKKQYCVTLSTLRPQQWSKLTAEFLAFALKYDYGKDEMNKGSKKKGNEFLSLLEKKSREYDEGIIVKGNTEEASSVETYECWRQRILDEAYAHLKNK